MKILIGLIILLFLISGCSERREIRMETYVFSCETGCIKSSQMGCGSISIREDCRKYCETEFKSIFT